MNLLKKIAFVGAALVALAGSAKADRIQVEFTNPGVNRSIFRVDQTSGATDGWNNGLDSKFYPANTPALDMYSSVSFDPYALKTDARGIAPENGGYSTIHSDIGGRGLSAPNNNFLKFTLPIVSENAFANKSILADLYNSSDVLLGTYNVKNLAATGTTIPITIDNGLSYKLDIRFEIPGDVNGDKVVDAADYIALKQNFGRSSGVGLEDGDLNVDGKVDWADLQTLMANFGSTGTAPANTPEPATGLSLLVLGGLGVLARGKKR